MMFPFDVLGLETEGMHALYPCWTRAMHPNRPTKERE